MAEFKFSIFNIFDQAFGTAWRVEVIKNVLKEKGRPLLREIEAKLRQLLIINGFRDPLKAPSAILVKKIKKLSFKFPDIMDLFVRAFLDLRPEILAGTGQSLAAEQDFLDAFRRKISEKEGNDKKALVGLVKEQQQQLMAEDGCQEKEAILTCLCFLYKQAEQGDEHIRESQVQEQKAGEQRAEEQGKELLAESKRDREQVGTAPAIDLDEWFDRLVALPADDHLWEGFDVFLESLQELAREKRKQQEEEGLIVFRKRLCLLADQYKEEVEFFCCEKLFEPDWEDISLADLPQINRLVDDLEENFRVYREIRNEKPGTVFEERRQQAQLRKRENQVLEILQCFSQFGGLQAAAPIPAHAADQREEEPASLSLKEIALLLRKEDCYEHQNTFFWKLIKESDLTGAYWFNKSLTAAGGISFLPDWLLEALIASQWLSSDTPYFIPELSQIAAAHQPDKSSLQQLLGVAAALCPVVMAPAAGIQSWLQAPECCLVLNDFIKAIKDFNGYEELGSTDHVSADAYERNILEKIQTAKKWLEDAGNFKNKNKRATAVWGELLCQENCLPALFLPVIKDKRSSVGEVRYLADQWSEFSYIKERINEIDLRLTGKKMRPITGEPREQIRCYILEGCEKAVAWCDLVEQEDKVRKTGDSCSAEQIKELRARVQDILQQLAAEIIELIEGRDLALTAAACCLGRSLAHLCWNIGLENPLSDCFPEALNTCGWLPRGAKNLTAGLSQRLWLLPEVNIEQDGLPTDEGLLTVSSALKDSYIEGRTLKKAFNGWLEKKDFRFLEALLQVIEERERLEEAEDCRVAWENELAELQLIT